MEETVFFEMGLGHRLGEIWILLHPTYATLPCVCGSLPQQLSAPESEEYSKLFDFRLIIADTRKEAGLMKLQNSSEHLHIFTEKSAWGTTLNRKVDYVGLLLQPYLP